MNPPKDFIWFESPAQMFTSPLIHQHRGTEVPEKFHQYHMKLREQVLTCVEPYTLPHPSFFTVPICRPVGKMAGAVSTVLKDYVAEYAQSPKVWYLEADRHAYDLQQSMHNLADMDYWYSNCDYKLESFDAYLSLPKQISMFLPYQGVCLLSERHIRFIFDNEDRPHCEDGIAISYSDGWGVYAWHGVPVPEYVIMRPDEITPQKIMLETNIDIVKVMIQRYGYEDFLRNSNLKKTQSDEYGDLYHIKFGHGYPDLVLIQSSGKHPEADEFFFARRNTSTAKDGVFLTYKESAHLIMYTKLDG